MVDGQAWTIFFCEYKSIECWVSEQSEGWLSSILCLIKTNYSAIPYVYLSTFFYNGTASAGMSGWTPAAANLPCLPIYCTTRQPARLLACLPARLLARTAAWVPSRTCLASRAHMGTACGHGDNMRNLLQHTSERDETYRTYAYNICIYTLQHMQHPDKIYTTYVQDNWNI
jgi:hypothetical protein